MEEKRFMVIEIVDGGVKPFTFSEEEVKSRHAETFSDKLKEFLLNSKPGDYMESLTAFIFNVNNL